MRTLFDGDEYDWEPPSVEPGERERCTPERLLAFIQELGRMPTLQECKTRFGGILGPLMDGATLRKRGLI